MPGSHRGYTVHVVSHTHWDREWYRTRQQFRLALAQTMDTVLEYLREDKGFRAFLLDGQAILVEDYLSLRRDRPEVERELRRHVAEGRLQIGPWYTQPDEFLISGESLVRNLQLGMEIAGRYGGALKFGWVPDTFGHASQLPQILNGFGITEAALTRGVGNHLSRPGSEFLWGGDEGSEVLVLHQIQGYFSAGLMSFPYFWGRVTPGDASPEWAIARMQPLLTALRHMSTGRHLILWNGADHMPPEPGLTETIRELNRWGRGTPEGYRFVHSTVEEAAAAVRTASPDELSKDLPLLRGELRGSRFHPLLYGILSTRTYLKQHNSRVEQLLERYTEPLDALGPFSRREEIRESRRLLLENHGHDSIGGCSIDAVHREMIHRFTQAEEIAREIALESLRGIAASAAAAGEGCLCFSPADRRGVSVVEHEFRRGLPLAEPQAAVDGAGRAHLVQVLSRELCDYGWLNRHTTVAAVRENLLWWGEVLRRMDGLRTSSFRIDPPGGPGAPLLLHLFLSDHLLPEEDAREMSILEALRDLPDEPVQILASFHRYRVVFAPELPPMTALPFRFRPLPGGAELRGTAPVPHAEQEEAERRPAVTGSADTRELQYSGGTVRCDPDGTLTLTTGDGAVLAGLNQLEIQEDGGDTYDFSPGGSAELLVPEEPPAFTLVHEGPVRATARVSAAYRRLGTVVTDVSVEADSPWISIRVELENTLRDCRLRARFPLREVSRSLADAPFSVEERPFVVDDREWVQPRAATAPHSLWVAAGGGGGGGALVVSAPGLPEHEVVSGKGLAITLLRCTGWLSRGDLDTREGHAGPMIAVPEAQCPGPALFEYRLRVFPDMDACAREVPVLAGAHLRPWSVPAAVLPGAAPGESLLDLTGTDFVLTGCYRDGEAPDEFLVARFYNCRSLPVKGRVRLHGSVSSCTVVKLDGTPLKELPISGDHTVEVPALPRQIITVRLGRSLATRPAP